MKSIIIATAALVIAASVVGTHQVYAWWGGYGYGGGWGCHHWWHDPANGYGQGYALGQQQQSSVIVINNNNNNNGYSSGYQPDP